MDTKPRELYLLFRAYSGYESSLLKVTNKNGKPSAPVGFVTFTTHQDANDARRKLQGVRFDPELSQTIRLELAKSNTKVSKPKQPSPPAFTSGGLNGGGGVITPNNSVSAAGFLPLHSHSAHDQAGLLAAAAASNNMFEQIQALNDQQQLLAANGMLSLPLQGLPLLHHHGGNQFLQQNTAALAAMAQLQQHHHHQQQQQQIFAANGMLNLMGNPAAASAVAAMNAAAAAAAAAANNSHSSGNANPPCSTLFVANLGSNPSEEEIRQLFKKFPGFCRLRLNNKSGSAVAFIEFNEVRNASMALTHLQGTQLASSERGNGIRIEYARTKMGEGVPSIPCL
uniref:RRM domain-containing protein n=1 Tax=Panagrolaimus superbus TaxID=310955 RepID=A0A914Z569_9BILA